MDEIVYTRGSDGQFHKTDNWAGSKRKAQIQIGDQAPFGDYTFAEATAFIEGALARPDQLKYDIYRIVSNSTAEPMPEAVKETLKAAAEQKKSDRPQIQCAFESCLNTFPRGRGRYPQKYCLEHRQVKT